MKSREAKITVLVIVVVIVVLASIASHYVGHVPRSTVVATNTSTLKTLQTPTTTPTSRVQGTSTLETTTHATVDNTYLFRIGNWTITIKIINGDKGVLMVKYTGSKPLIVENPLLPLVAGLNIVLSYDDPSRNTVVRRPGTYYYNTSIEIKPGNESMVSFNARGLRLLRVEGEILGKIPVRIMLPLNTLTSRTSRQCVYTRTITVTETITVNQTLQTTTSSYCEFTREAEYHELPSSKLTRVEASSETLISDGTLRIHVPLVVSGPRIPLTFENTQNTPLWILASYVEYVIVNFTEDGVHYKPVNYKAVYAVPTTTIPPLPPSCRSKKPSNTILVYHDSIYMLKPGEKATLLALTIPISIDELKGFREGWIYIKAKISYAPIREVYRVNTNVEYLSKYKAIALYNTRELEVEFRVYVKP